MTVQSIHPHRSTPTAEKQHTLLLQTGQENLSNREESVVNNHNIENKAEAIIVNIFPLKKQFFQSSYWAMIPERNKILSHGVNESDAVVPDLIRKHDGRAINPPSSR